MKVQILYKSLHRDGWISAEAPTLGLAIKQLDRDFKETMELNNHINMYQIVDFKINLIK